MQVKHRGFIDIWWPNPKNYGFVHENGPGGTKKYFGHITNVLSGTPQSGAAVLFNVGRNAKGATAIDVEIVADDPADLLSGGAL